MLAVQMQNISKRFVKSLANDSVSLDVPRGTIHALVGENGAGKSTLMNILYGMHQPDGGTISIHEQPQKIDSPSKAISLGIGMVHQHFMLVSPLTVTENIMLGNERTRFVQFLDLRNTATEISKLSEVYRLKIDPHSTIASLSVGLQQRVEILKILYRNAGILILDEPTAVLAPQEIDDLFTTLVNLKKQDKTVILITHKLNEVMSISDNITVMRQGKVVGNIKTAETTQGELAKLMVGRFIEPETKKAIIQSPINVLEVTNVSAMSDRKLPALQDISFSVKSGEIFGIAGVEGNGQTELVEVLTRLRSPTSGEIRINKTEITDIKSKSNIAHIPEDRLKRGLVLDLPLADNLILGRQQEGSFSGIVFLHIQNVTDHAEKMIRQFDIRPANKEYPARALSGGNQQKVVIARELSKKGDVIIASQPTRGLDIGAIEYVHNAILSERNNGKAVVLVSSDLSELLKLSDRIGVIYRGSLAVTLEAQKTNEREIGIYMTGGTQQIAV